MFVCVCDVLVSPYLKSLSMVASTKLLHLLEVRHVARSSFTLTVFHILYTLSLSQCVSSGSDEVFLIYVSDASQHRILDV